MVYLPPNGSEDDHQEAGSFPVALTKIEPPTQGPLQPEDSVVPFEADTNPHLRDATKSSMTYIVATLSHVVQAGLSACKNPIWWILWAYFAWMALTKTTPWLVNTVEIPGLCEMPVISNHVPYCTPPTLSLPDFRQLVTLQSQLQGTMEKSTNTLMVAMDIKRSEMAVRDLTTLVQLSSLVSKDSLVKNLKLFVNDARDTGRSLQKFGSHVGSAVDQIVATNEYTLEILESSAKEVQPELSLAYFSSISPQAVAARNKEINAVWLEATGTMKTTIQKLTLEAVANMRALDNLDGQLSVIHKMVAREDNRNTAKEAETLSHLWTSLGGNKGKKYYMQLAHFSSHAKLLREVLDYRKEAAKHVSSTLFQLERLAQDLKELNDQVTAPLLASESSGTSLEAQIRTMQRGTARLLEGRAREREREDRYIRDTIDGVGS